MTKYYTIYKEKVLSTLTKDIKGNGCWQGKGEYPHILKLEGENSKENRRKAIRKLFPLSTVPKSAWDHLHQYAHHLNSSQLLCFMTFSKLIDSDGNDGKATLLLRQVLERLPDVHIDKDDIQSNTPCHFEYNDSMKWTEENENEGTEFDFHIGSRSTGEKEFFFEIKFTEDGFGTAKDDDRHHRKIQQLYLPQIKNICFENTIVTEDQVRKFYQIFRNVIRVTQSAHVLFITDKNNPSTEREIDAFKKLFETKLLFWDNIHFIHWQDIAKAWNQNIAKPFQFNCFE